eukprot:scaffold10.g2484.t1
MRVLAVNCSCSHGQTRATPARTSPLLDGNFAAVRTALPGGPDRWWPLQLHRGSKVVVPVILIDLSEVEAGHAQPLTWLAANGGGADRSRHRLAADPFAGQYTCVPLRLRAAPHSRLLAVSYHAAKAAGDSPGEQERAAWRFIRAVGAAAARVRAPVLVGGTWNCCLEGLAGGQGGGAGGVGGILQHPEWQAQLGLAAAGPSDSGACAGAPSPCRPGVDAFCLVVPRSAPVAAAFAGGGRTLTHLFHADCFNHCPLACELSFARQDPAAPPPAPKLPNVAKRGRCSSSTRARAEQAPWKEVSLPTLLAASIAAQAPLVASAAAALQASLLHLWRADASSARGSATIRAAAGSRKLPPAEQPAAAHSPQGQQLPARLCAQFGMHAAAAQLRAWLLQAAVRCLLLQRLPSEALLRLGMQLPAAAEGAPELSATEERAAATAPGVAPDNAGSAGEEAVVAVREAAAAAARMADLQAEQCRAEATALAAAQQLERAEAAAAASAQAHDQAEAATRAQLEALQERQRLAEATAAAVAHERAREEAAAAEARAATQAAVAAATAALASSARAIETKGEIDEAGPTAAPGRAPASTGGLLAVRPTPAARPPGEAQVAEFSPPGTPPRQRQPWSAAAGPALSSPEPALASLLVCAEELCCLKRDVLRSMCHQCQVRGAERSRNKRDMAARLVAAGASWEDVHAATAAVTVATARRHKRSWLPWRHG